MRSRLLLLLALSTGCTSWRPVALPTPEQGDSALTGEWRFIDTAGVKHYGREVVLGRETVRFLRDDRIRDSLPRGAVASMEERHTNSAGTLAVILILVLTAIGIYSAATMDISTSY